METRTVFMTFCYCFNMFLTRFIQYIQYACLVLLHLKWFICSLTRTLRELSLTWKVKFQIWRRNYETAKDHPQFKPLRKHLRRLKKSLRGLLILRGAVIWLFWSFPIFYHSSTKTGFFFGKSLSRSISLCLSTRLFGCNNFHFHLI